MCGDGGGRRGVGDQEINICQVGEGHEVLLTELRGVGERDDAPGGADHGAFDGGLVGVGGGQTVLGGQPIGAYDGDVDAGGGERREASGPTAAWVMPRT